MRNPSERILSSASIHQRRKATAPRKRAAIRNRAIASRNLTLESLEKRYVFNATLLVDFATNSAAVANVTAADFAAADPAVQTTAPVRTIDAGGALGVAGTGGLSVDIADSNAGNIFTTNKGLWVDEPILDSYLYVNAGSRTITVSGLEEINAGESVTVTMFGVGDAPNQDTRFTLNYDGEAVGTATTDYDANDILQTRVSFSFLKESGVDSLAIVFASVSGTTSGAMGGFSITVGDPPPPAIRINAGGDTYIDAAGNTYLADQDFVGGDAFSSTATVLNTPDPVLYLSERFGDPFSYEIPVDNGLYQLRLHYAEIFFDTIGERVFDVTAEGQLITNDLDIFEARENAFTPGKNAALIQQFETIQVIDGALSLSFDASIDNAKVSAIEVIPVTGAGLALLTTDGGTTVNEGGAGDSYGVVLSQAPTSVVTLHIDSGSQVTTAPATLTFTSTDWNVAQNVVVNAVDDLASEGTQTIQVGHSFTSADPFYSGLLGPSLQVVVNDNEGVPVDFDLRTLASGFSHPTAGAFGTDGRLYVANQFGAIRAYTLDADNNVIATQNINTIANASSFNNVLGIAFNPFEDLSGGQTPTLYLTRSALFVGTNIYGSRVSTLSGPNFDVSADIVTGLPVSGFDHGINGLQFDDRGDLLIAVGGNTNTGVFDGVFGSQSPESPLTSAILRAPITASNFNGNIQYEFIDPNDPGIPELAAGPNDQRNGNFVRPVVAPGQVGVETYAVGLRNPYDLVYTTDGLLFATDNGPNGIAEDELNRVSEGDFLGHPSIPRGKLDPTQTLANAQYDPAAPSTADYTAPLASLPSSTDGLDEYRAETFGGLIRGNLLAQRYNGQVYSFTRSADGTQITNTNERFDVGNGLDLWTGPGGVVFGADRNDNRVTIAEPVDPTVVTPTPYDISPWRAPAAGGNPFVIGGVQFGSLANTTVTIGGQVATLTEVSDRRIVGVLPTMAGTGDLVDVIVTSSGVTKTLDDAFLPLIAPSDLPGQPQSPGTPATGFIPLLSSEIFDPLASEGQTPSGFFSDDNEWYTFRNANGVDKGYNEDQGKSPGDDDVVFRMTPTGELHILGVPDTGQTEPFGYISTDDSYRNYHLTLEYQWGTEKFNPRNTSIRDSGLLYHSPPQDETFSNWPDAPETQIQEGDTGDFFFLWSGDKSKGTVTVAPGTNRYQPGGTSNSGTDFGVTASQVADTLTGWNRVEVIIEGDRVTTIVNGIVVNRATDLVFDQTGGVVVPLTEGKIQLQAEGAEVIYRNVSIKPISAVGGTGAFKVLVFQETAGFTHAIIGDAQAAIERLGAANGFAVDVATNSSGVFTAANLAQYDAVIWNSTTGNVLDSAEQTEFENYIQGGGGFVGLHAAADTEYDWAWYGDLIGAYFQNHPAQQQATVRVDAEASVGAGGSGLLHPAADSLPTTGWQRFDEWYNYQANPRSDVNVLLTLDESTYNENDGTSAADDHPIAWWHDFDGGRSFYTGLGHTSQSYTEPLYLTHLLGGIEYAAGVSRVAPSDATIVFAGTDTSGFTTDGSWSVDSDGNLIAGSTDATSVANHADQRIHLEFQVPVVAAGDAPADSGLLIGGSYELQIVDSYGESPTDQTAGALLGVAAPSTNAVLPAETWQTYDIEFTAARYDFEGQKVANARLTAYLNGTLIHNDIELTSPTTGAPAEQSGLLPIVLKGSTTGPPVAFRNVWVQSTDVSTPVVAVDDAYTIAEDGILTVAMPGLIGNDLVGSMGPIGVDVTPEFSPTPANGTVTQWNVNGSFTYVPDANFTGTDSFQYRVTGGDGTSDVGMVTITVTNQLEIDAVRISEDPVDRDPVLGHSIIDVIRVQFDGTAIVEETAFVIEQDNGGSFQAVPIAPLDVTTDAGGVTTVEIRFVSDSPGLVNAFGSLENGTYRMQILGDRIRDTSAVQIGMQPNVTDGFFAKYGNFDGIGLVGLSDFAEFRSAFGTNRADNDEAFVDGIDYDRDGRIGLSDFAAFRSAFGT